MICGDIVGKAGRDALKKHLPLLCDEVDIDFIIVNGENAAHGFGITEKICASFFELGVDAITTGNHIWDKKEIIKYIGQENRLLRPLNFPEGTPGNGFGLFKSRIGKRVLVINVMGQLFMKPIRSPFKVIEEILKKYRLGIEVDIILVDFHCEATSEKQAMGHLLDGRVSVMVGTHTHVPTSDYQILEGGSGYQTDLGMTGDYDSVIGMKKQAALGRFMVSDDSTAKSASKNRLEPAGGEGTLCGTIVEISELSGLASSIRPVRLGGRLSESVPN